MLRVEHEGGASRCAPGRRVVAQPGEWVRYSSPEADGAEYVAVCLPAFSPDTVHRDDAEPGASTRCARTPLAHLVVRAMACTPRRA